MIRRMASGLVMAVLLAVLCVPAAGQWVPSVYIAMQIDMSALQDSYLNEPLPDTYTDGEPPCADDYSAWYMFTLTEATQVGFYAAGYAEGEPLGPPIANSRVEVQAALYREDGGLVELHCATGGIGLDVQFIELLSAGTYYVQVGTAAPPHSYRLVVAPSPANDEISGAQQLSLPALYFRYQAATTSSGDGEYTCADQHSLWFKFTLNETQKINFFADAVGFGGPGQSAAKMGLYKDGDTLSLIKCTGDGVGEQPFFDAVAFTKRLEAGTYYLQVGTTGYMPYYHLVLLNGVPANDDRADAKLLTFPFGNEWDWAAPSEGAFITLATMEKGVEPAANPACPSALYHSIWYKFKLTERRSITLTKAGPSVITGPSFPDDILRPIQYMDVWRKTGSGLQPAACSSKGLIEKTLDAGTYFLRIASPIRAHKHIPSDFSVAGKSEPVGMPTIIDQPEDVYINSGQAATFSVAVSSPTPVSYQWYSGYSGDTSYPIDGATGPVYTTPDVFGSGASSVWVRVTNAAGSRDSANAWFNYRYITTVDLLENGDFEAGSSGWTLKNGSADKISCNDKGYESPCAFVFKGGIGEKAKISQTQPLPPASYESRLVLKLDAKTKSTNKPFVVMATVTYSDGKPPMVKKLTYPALSGSAYTRLSDNVTSYGPSDAVEAVTLSIRHKSATGKTFIDEVELQLLQFAGPWRSDGVLPPPDAPEGLRGTN